VPLNAANIVAMASNFVFSLMAMLFLLGAMVVAVRHAHRRRALVNPL